MGFETASQSALDIFLAQPIDKIMLDLFWLVGWIPIALVFVWGTVLLFVYWRQIKFSKTLKFTLLAIDIPRGNEQSLKAVESLFTYLGGAHDEPDLIEKYWDGRYQLAVSFEIVGIEGYTQFLMRTPNEYRDLMEAAVYAVYPDAEITEVNDYTDGIPITYPNDEYNVWGAELLPVKPHCYPIKTWKEFEVMGAKPGEGFKDPMATLMDMYGSLKKGEQFWFQLIVYPMGFEWPKKGDEEISKIIGEKVKAKQTLFGSIMNFPALIIDNLVEILFGIQFSPAEKTDEKDTFKMMNLKPKQKKQIEAIQDKISKLGFDCKIRFVYVAKKEVYKKEKAIFGIIGYIKQFLDMDLNNLKPDMAVTATTAHYLFIDYRKNLRKSKFMSAYRDRTGTRGRKRFVLTPDELATLWHFPVETAVKAPLIQKAQGRRAEPPMSLPIAAEVTRGLPGLEKGEYEDIFSDLKESDKETISATPKPMPDIFTEDAPAENEMPREKGTPPSNLPFAD